MSYTRGKHYPKKKKKSRNTTLRLMDEYDIMKRKLIALSHNTTQGRF